MTQEDKELQLKDLSARLSYKTYVKTPKGIGYVYAINTSQLVELSVANDSEYWSEVFNIDEIKTYLRPLSSMTEEEKETYHNLCYEEEREELEFGEWEARIHYHDTIDSIDYLNSIHIDYRDLIPKGLAIEVTKENNPYKKLKL